MAYCSDFFFFTLIVHMKHQDPVNSTTTDGCWIEFIGYRKPGKSEIAAQCYSQDISKQNIVRLFRYFDWLWEIRV